MSLQCAAAALLGIVVGFVIGWVARQPKPRVVLEFVRFVQKKEK